MTSPTGHDCHQALLEGVSKRSLSEQPSGPDQRTRMTEIFKQIISHYEPLQPEDGPYKHITLLKLTYGYVLSNESRDKFLKYFLKSVKISVEDEFHFEAWDPKRKSELASHLDACADFLVNSFFLPMKSSGRKTPKPTPPSLSDAPHLQEMTGTRSRVASLQAECLERDRHRCVISRVFDYAEAKKRYQLQGLNEAKDDEGNLLKYERNTFASLEVAYILPHSLLSVTNAKSPLEEYKKTTLAILDMFDSGISLLIKDNLIDKARSAITLSHDLHQRFSNFEVYFEPTSENLHTYWIQSTEEADLQIPIFPVTRAPYLATSRPIDPPSERFLAVHRAITLILHLSAAGSHLDKILEDLEETDIKEDGSTELGRLVELKFLSSWNDGVYVY